jgi:lysophospholipase L1-like esterase
MSFKALSLVLLTLLSASSLRADDHILVKDGQKVAFLGDSITFQGWEVPGGYVKLVTAGFKTLGVNITPVPAGVGGNTSRDMLARLQNDVIAKKPDWMTLSCGVNDVWHGPTGCTLEEFQKNITAILDQCQAAGIKVVVMTATVIGEDDNDNNKKLVAYNDFLRQIAKSRNLPLAEENLAFQAAIKATPTRGDLANTITGDGVHPRTEGHQVMASTLLQAFGATPDEVKKVQAAWFDMPDSAAIEWKLEFPEGGITIHQWEILKSESTKRGTPISNLTDTLFFEAMKDTIKAHENDTPPITRFQIIGETQKRFGEKISALPSTPIH